MRSIDEFTKQTFDKLAVLREGKLQSASTSIELIITFYNIDLLIK